MAEEKSSERKSSFKQPVVIGAIALVLIALALAAYFYLQYRKSQSLLQNPTLAAQLQTQNLLTAVGKLYALPKDESPTIATVSDITKLSSQPFFAKARNGDKVLIYTKNRLAILYNPGQNIIVNVAPVNLGSPTPSVSPSASSGSSTPTVSVKGAKTAK